MINIKKITDGDLDGKRVWICDLRYNDYNKKPIRNIKPIKVLVRSNKYTTRKVYYSESHFVGYDRNGKLLKSKVIVPFDNTGCRSFTGTPVNCFETEEECVAHYKKQVRIAIKGLKDCRKKLTANIDKKIEELKDE